MIKQQVNVSAALRRLRTRQLQDLERDGLKIDLQNEVGSFELKDMDAVLDFSRRLKRLNLKLEIDNGEFKLVRR